ncbi:hypothetical protein A1O7_09922 [Cladophialophora yegresii CBS 114405]|uniref:Gag1-like clamp domain-containing protein n=1 Tax=Cladophialophora yegresii CBS 114405 TaxID=1182544 RepID=W9VQZ0_9EURO|nr:uncharacterized protein A1O7_09922 [Cladophialophora yegresii CBS 114405]EXJ54581.1 hypothetical protein A1O7_09922 [Cladophialophora yegresii CBS 114405]
MSQSSPRPSVDGHGHVAPPFLHTLTQRLRKGSSASSQYTDSAPSNPVTVDPLSKTEATRAARRMILSLVRDDWDWPNLPPEALADDNKRILPREPISFRLREEAQSDIEAEVPHNKRRSKSDPYKFESPDTVGDVIAERRRKRRKQAEEEMAYNEGLRIWQERRDAWTGALQHRPYNNRPTERRPSPTTKRPSYKSRLSQVFVRDKAADHNPRAHSQSLSTDGGSSWPASPVSPTPESSSINSLEAVTPGITTGTTTNTTVEPNTPLTPVSTTVPTASSSSTTEPGPWLPIYPPMLPKDDIISEKIKPAAYPTIYSKIVVQGLSPNIPIPLSHMIPALVEGWKSEGNWPPQPSAPLAADVKRGRKSSTFAKWRKEHSDNKQQGGEVAVVGSSRTNDDEAAGQHRSSIRRSIGMMRKMGSFLGGAMSSTDGLDELGIEFSEKDQAGLDRNVALNKGLVH